MDYEKKYNEALERARKLREGFDGYNANVAIIEQIFPELRESEDERMARAINNMLPFIPDESYANNGVTKEGVLNWLEKQKESLHISESCKENANSFTSEQKEQKPAEWSKEDEEMLNCCISSIEEAKENRYAYKETDGDTSYDREIDWLKSLRPSWKPSEEQMEALLWCTAHLGGADYRVLAELYEHLKMYCK